jgi:hypothetical protein
VKSRHYEKLPEIVPEYERMHILRRAFGHICTFGPPDPSPRSKNNVTSSLLSFWVMMKLNATFVTEGQQKPYFVFCTEAHFVLDTEGRLRLDYVQLELRKPVGAAHWSSWATMMVRTRVHLGLSVGNPHPPSPTIKKKNT